MVLLADGERESAVIRSRCEAALMVLRVDGERASTVLRAKGAAAARQSLAQAERQCLSDLRTSVAPFGVRGVDYYLSTLEYLGNLGGLSAGGDAKVVLVPSASVDMMKVQHTLALLLSWCASQLHCLSAPPAAHDGPARGAWAWAGGARLHGVPLVVHCRPSI